MLKSACILLLLSGSIAAQTVSLQGVTVHGSQVTVVYSKDFATCAHLKLLNGTLVHSANFFCTQGTNVAITLSTSSFNASFGLGVQVKLCHGNNGSICSAPVTIAVDPTISADPPVLSLNAGGAHQIAFNASALGAGAIYVVVGSASGTVPGFTVGPFLVPLNIDPWFAFTLENPDTFPLSTFQGVLDASGSGVATITLPPGLSAAFAGLTLHHAVGIVANGVIAGVSTPVAVTLVP